MSNAKFTCVEESYVDELAGTAKLWRHNATGAQILSFINSDENKVFGVTFRTPPKDSTGVAHILEHSVLCGSEKYPVKEPFVALLKGSLQTFLNAFTYPDKTCYPVASTNLADFRNLTDVYLDAVFFPRITEDIFQQEGWHLEGTSSDGPFTYKGVVYNEMKGAFSAPESVLSRYCLHALFPDNVYGLESGGDPEVIPQLTYADFVKFHRDYYHPSNARFFFWGDDPEEERLAQLATVLDRFTAHPVDSGIALQPFFQQPRKETVPFAAAEGEKAMAVVNWLGPETKDIELVLALRILEHILLGLPSSPLRRALIESGLGEDLAGHGLEMELRQLSFGVGMKGVEVASVEKVEALIYTTLQDIVDKSIPSGAIDAAINTIEFSLRENNTGRFPVGLSVMLRSLTTWLYDENPLQPLKFTEPLDKIKKLAHAGTGYFEALIKRWLIDNPHRVTIFLQPDTALAIEQEEKERKLLESIAASMTPAEREAVVKNTEHLLLWQSTPDSPEALATIPQLGVKDLPRENTLIPEKALEQPVRCDYHALATGGIAYVEAYFSLRGVQERLLPLIPLFGRALLEMGTRDHDFVALNTAVAAHTGGMDADTTFLLPSGTVSPDARFCLSGKAAPDKVSKLFDLIVEVLTACDFDNKDRFFSMVLEEKARQEHGLVPSGHAVVAGRLRAHFSSASWLEEQVNGVEGLFALRALVERVQSDWASVLDDLHLIRDNLLCKDNVYWNITALPEQEKELIASAASVTQSLPVFSGTDCNWLLAADFPQAEAMLLPAQVNYVGKAVNLFKQGYQWHGSAAVALKYLRTGYLWEKVRVQGGAYGCVCSLDRFSGTFAVVSYRDPNITPTLQVYDGIAAYLTHKDFSTEDLNAAIVGAIGELDAYMLPDAKGTAAFLRKIAKDTPEARQRLREEILGTTAKDIKNFGEALQSLVAKGHICIMGGNALEREAEQQNWKTLKLL